MTNYKGDLLSFLAKCGCTASPADMFKTNTNPSVVCEIQVDLTIDGVEKSFCEYSEVCGTKPQAEYSAILHWMEMNPELCPPLAETLKRESAKVDFANHLTIHNSSVKINYKTTVNQFICIVRVPLGDDQYIMRSLPSTGKKIAENDAARKWMEVHQSIYESASRMKGLLRWPL
jgi:hypothetical protein